MFTIFNFTLVAPGVIHQLQPQFIQRRDIYDAREKKSRMYSWKAFVAGLIISEFPISASVLSHISSASTIKPICPLVLRTSEPCSLSC